MNRAAISNFDRDLECARQRTAAILSQRRADPGRVAQVRLVPRLRGKLKPWLKEFFE